MGSGAFGDVYIAYHIETHRKVAVKLLKEQYTDWEKCLELREIKCLMKVKHRYIIELLEVFQTEGKLCLVFEYADGNLLDMYLKQAPKSLPS